MIYDNNALNVLYKDYSNINQKISLETKKGNLIRIKRGLYSNNLKIDAHVIALSYYGIIPEYVSIYTSAVYNKKNNKMYKLGIETFEYRSIPNEAFSEGIRFFKNEDDINYKMASIEKALCDTLYSKYPVRSISDLKILLFEDLRIDEEMFNNLNFEFIKKISTLYHSNTLLTLNKYIKEIEKCQQSMK